MTDEDELSQIVIKADNIIKDHNGVYLEKRLYDRLKTEFPNLSRKDFQEVISQLSKRDYSLQRGLIKRLTDKESEKLPKQLMDNKKSGKGDSERPRIPDKKGL